MLIWSLSDEILKWQLSQEKLLLDGHAMLGAALATIMI